MNIYNNLKKQGGKQKTQKERKRNKLNKITLVGFPLVSPSNAQCGLFSGDRGSEISRAIPTESGIMIDRGKNGRLDWNEYM